MRALYRIAMAQKYHNIRRSRDVIEGHPDWTEGKEQAAQIIQDKIDNGEWPVSLEQLDDETEWSRSHYRNTIRDLFETADETAHEKPTFRTRNIQIPESVEHVEDYLRGVANGYQLRRKQE